MKINYFGALGALLLGSMPALAVQTDNYGLKAVPIPGAVAINGDLADWDLSGQVIMTYDLETLSDVYSARVATMYDRDNLYISLHWKDPVPMGNSHDPRYTANKGWAGDCVQLRVMTDRISHVTAWYHAGKQEPAIDIGYGKSLTEPFGGGNLLLMRTQGWKMDQGAEMGFKRDADGKGYVQEMKLPWKLLTNSKTYGAGDTLRMGFELLWGEEDWPVHRYADNLQPGSSGREFFWTGMRNWGDVYLSPQGKLKLPEPAYLVAYRKATQGETPQGPVDISYNLPKNARVTLAINDAAGNRVRNLVPALPRKQGKNLEKWDGMDDNGKAVPPGAYTYKALYHDGLKTNYVMSFASPGNPTWGTPDNRGAFYGDHTAPQAAAAGGNFVALATPMGEAGKHLIATDLTGQRLWGLNNRVAFDGGQISLATDGKLVWVATEGKKSIIYRVEAANGKYAPWAAKAKDAAGNEFDLLELVVSESPGMGTDPTHKLGPNMRSVALRDGALAVSLLRDNSVKLLDANTGALRREFSINGPAAIAYLPTGDLVVLAENKLHRLGAEGKISAFSALDFSEAYGLTTDAAGRVYVSVRGADQNVKVLSSTGQLVREIGKRGGRPLIGQYDAGGMRHPAGLAVDSEGKLWVTEETMNPKRTSVWNTTTGQLIKDLAGTTTYAGAGAINPYDPTIGYSDNTVYKLDLAKGTFTPTHSLGSPSRASHALVKDHPDDIFPPVVHSLTSKVVRRDNQTYIFTSGTARGAVDLHATLFDGTNYRSVAHVGTVATGKNREGENKRFDHPFFEGQEGKTYSWTDANGDGLVQLPELFFTNFVADGKAIGLRSNYWGQLPDTDGAVTFMVAPTAGGPVLADTLLKLHIKSINAVGAPVYDLIQPQIVKVSSPIISIGSGMISGGYEGRVFLNQNPLVSLDKNGKVLGTYPNRFVSVHGSHNAKASRPGYLIGPSSFLGSADMGKEIGEVFYLNGNLGENFLFTHDGLYIQTLFKDTRGYFDTPNRAVRGMSMDATTAGGESFGGNFIKAVDGKTYLTLGGTDATVSEISGLPSIKRFGGKITYTPAQYVAAQELAQKQAVEATEPRVYTIARSAQAPTIDGKATEWPELLDDNKAVLEVRESPSQRYGRVQARYDDQNLYLGYRVFARSNAMKNSGQDDRLLFKTGDAVDIMLGPDESKKGEGQLRLLLAQLQGKPVAVINQKFAPGAAAAEKFDFSSPWRTISFDRVKVLPTVQIATGSIAGGYFLEAAIPWKELGINPRSGLKLRGDVGILFANVAGTETISRLYWSNKSTGLVNDVPGEADLTPGLWGTFNLE